MHRIFLKPQYKVYIGASILYFSASLSDVPSSSKISLLPGYSQQMVKCCLPLLSFKISLKANIYIY